MYDNDSEGEAKKGGGDGNSLSPLVAHDWAETHSGYDCGLIRGETIQKYASFNKALTSTSLIDGGGGGLGGG